MADRKQKKYDCGNILLEFIFPLKLLFERLVPTIMERLLPHSRLGGDNLKRYFDQR